MRGRPRVRPDRRPQDERHARPARAGVRGGQREPAREPRHHRPVVARGGECVDIALTHPQHRERTGVLARPAAVADVAADERERHLLALVERGERADAERRRVVGDEQDGAAHPSASS